MARWIALSLLALLIPAAWATHWHHSGWFCDPSGVRNAFNHQFISGPEQGLVVVSAPMTVASAIHLGNRKGFTLVLFTDTVSFEATASVRYSIDGLHWSDWVALIPRLPSERSQTVSGLWCDAEACAPDLSGATLMFDNHIVADEPGPLHRAAWVEWVAQEEPRHAFSYDFYQWAAVNRPDIFAESIPGYAYLQYRLSSDRPDLSVQRLYLGLSTLRGSSWRSVIEDPEIRALFLEREHSWDFLHPDLTRGDEECDFMSALGDIDRSGECDIRDLVRLTDHVSSWRVLQNPASLLRADVNVDGVADQWDVERMVAILLGD